jgi:hypothetical protein
MKQIGKDSAIYLGANEEANSMTRRLYRTPQEIRENHRAFTFSESQKKNARLKKKYGRGKGIGYASFKFVGKVEELIFDYDSADTDLEREIAMSALFETVEPKLKAWAKYLTYTKYERFKLLHEDFYSVVLEAFWDLLNKPQSSLSFRSEPRDSSIERPSNSNSRELLTLSTWQSMRRL